MPFRLKRFTNKYSTERATLEKNFSTVISLQMLVFKRILPAGNINESHILDVGVAAFSSGGGAGGSGG